MSPHPTALVTGGAGFIGSHLTEALLGRGYRVVVLDNLSTGRRENLGAVMGHPHLRFVEGSVTDAALVDSLVEGCDVVFHLAAAVGVELIVKDPVSVIETNVLGTRAVLKAASHHGRKVLLASTSEIYGKSEQVPFREEDDRVLGPTTRARWSYSTSKAVDEYLALAYHRQMGLPVVIFRLFNTVGPRQTGRYGMVLPRLVGQALRGEPLTVYGDGRQSRCFLDVADAVAAIIALAESPRAVGGVFNVGSQEEVTILELAHLVLRAVGQGDHWEERIAFIPYERVYGEGFEDMRRRVPDIGRIRTVVGWEPTIPLEETVRRVVHSHREAEASLRGPRRGEG